MQIDTLQKGENIPFHCRAKACESPRRSRIPPSFLSSQAGKSQVLTAFCQSLQLLADVWSGGGGLNFRSTFTELDPTYWQDLNDFLEARNDSHFNSKQLTACKLLTHKLVLFPRIEQQTHEKAECSQSTSREIEQTSRKLRASSLSEKEKQ